MFAQKNKNIRLLSKPIGIYGLGITGCTSYEFLKSHNINIICWDDNQLVREKFISQYRNMHIKDLAHPDWQNLQEIIVSPGIRRDHYIFNFASKHKIKITSDMEIFYEASRNSNFIGITGTNGKSTTTALIAHILQFAEVDHGVGGNIGIPILSLPINKKNYVLEISSFQLDLLNNLKLSIAALLNITPDHLDRYSNMQNYINSKMQIFDNMSAHNFAVINVDNEITAKIIRERRIGAQIIPFSVRQKLATGVAIIENKIYDNVSVSAIYSLPFNKYLQGEHNIENIAVSYAICRLLEVPIDRILSAIGTFTGLKHRMQYLGEIENISFYNDSKATNIDSAAKSISALDNIYWLAGGIAKENNLNKLAAYFGKIKKAYLYGRDKQIFADCLKNNVDFELFDNMADAFTKALNDARVDNLPYKSILLAPAAASLDQFKNFEDRGERFINLYSGVRPY